MLGGADNPNGELPSYITGLTHALETAKDMRWNYCLLSDRGWSGRYAAALNAEVNGVYLSRSNFDVAFDDDGHQVKPTDGPTDRECCRCNQAV